MSQPDETTEEIRLSLGAEDGFVVMNVGQYTLRLTADQADAMATDLRTYSIEVRAGGKLS